MEEESGDGMEEGWRDGGCRYTGFIGREREREKERKTVGYPGGEGEGSGEYHC